MTPICWNLDLNGPSAQFGGFTEGNPAVDVHAIDFMTSWWRPYIEIMDMFLSRCQADHQHCSDLAESNIDGAIKMFVYMPDIYLQSMTCYLYIYNIIYNIYNIYNIVSIWYTRFRSYYMLSTWHLPILVCWTGTVVFQHLGSLKGTGPGKILMVFSCWYQGEVAIYFR